MEYFLPLSVMAMIISSISIFLIDYQNPTSNIDPENDQSSPNPSEKIEEDTVDEFTVSENEENLQKSINPEEISEESSIKKIHSADIILKEFQKSFSMLNKSTSDSILSTSKS